MMSQPAKLKTTHRTADPAATVATTAHLPSGWTEHRAPTGHLYYYNASTKESTYRRPTEALSSETQSIPSFPLTQPQIFPTQHLSQGSLGQSPGRGHISTYHHDETRQRRQNSPEDRPKHQQQIPGASPWLLVRTKLRRRFVHNPETGESLWRFPKDVMKAVIYLDAAERREKEHAAQGIHGIEQAVQPSAAGHNREDADSPELDSDEYEEVEVTDDEEEEGNAQGSKRQRIDEGNVPPGPIEFGEDDIAAQLAQLEAGIDDDGGGSYEDDDTGLSEEDLHALFMDLLDDHKISPFAPWDSVVADGKIIDDERYTVLPNMRNRREVYDKWVRIRVAEIRRERERQVEQDPRIPYLAFLAAKATPKLYWQEFRRKYQKEPEMKSRKLTDKDREKWYREHILRLKLTESDRKKDLKQLLESLPIRDLNRGTSIDALPGILLRDIRYISLPAKIRDPLVEGFINIAPDAPEGVSELSSEEFEKQQKKQANRKRREKALAERERAAREQKEKQRRDLAYSKSLLKEEEQEVRKAMRVGRDGLISHLEEDL